MATLLLVTASQSFSQELPKSEVNGSLKDECKKLIAYLENALVSQTYPELHSDGIVSE